MRFRRGDIVEVIQISGYDADCGLTIGAYGYVLSSYNTLNKAYRVRFVGLAVGPDTGGFPMFNHQLRKVGHAKVPRAR